MYSCEQCTVSGCVLHLYNCGQCTVWVTESLCVTRVQLWTAYCELLCVTHVQLWTMYCEWLCVTRVQLWTVYCESLSHCVLHCTAVNNVLWVAVCYIWSAVDSVLWVAESLCVTWLCVTRVELWQGCSYIWGNRGGRLGCFQDCCLSESNITSTIFSERAWVHVHYMLSPVRLSVVCNVRAPYSGGSNFPQYFYGIRYLGHPLTSTENFTEIVPVEPLRRGS